MIERILLWLAGKLGNLLGWLILRSHPIEPARWRPGR